MSKLRSKCGPEATIRRRLNRETDSVTVSYRRDDGLYATVIGRGRRFDDRMRDADSQLPSGEWTRLCVSTPTSIFADLAGRDFRGANDDDWHGSVDMRAYTAYELQTVIVP